MILDSMKNAKQYVALHPRFAEVFAFLSSPSAQAFKEGRTELDGKELYVIASNGSGKTTTDARLETHHRYIDIHYLIAGRESMGWKSADRCEDVEQPYDPERDIMFFSDDPAVWLTIHPACL